MKLKQDRIQTYSVTFSLQWKREHDVQGAVSRKNIILSCTRIYVQDIQMTIMHTETIGAQTTKITLKIFFLVKLIIRGGKKT